ncbi:MAG: hypothetical protein A3I29_04560 [Candidatus Magasanikbacteria bacterium RIFCSPLOWO2_02_FULL_44_11]|uniref:Addiction module toxin RelE n=2 Tax=Candidatus Magasanikiibacteriota TaxID=1752731 RepID=A0A1F6N9W3_9BACT|nr:MAG: hypothetical protein A3D53_03710 [Candidatus Magasanikbacteria bacterium RIFCSPHIGHO2_02_FULL_45_10]OGH80513.1 MAG: hypothetical protein A3I29_04560 [Candidatus Magasanikbacteria bacterium RIFCSPLOWO2_02_FULL_44_11]
MRILFFYKSIGVFINTLDRSAATKVLRTINLLERFGSQLKMPHSKKIDRDLFELRIRGQQEIRLLYTFYKDGAILLHGFIKKTEKMPLRELLTARHKLTLLDVT